MAGRCGMMLKREKREKRETLMGARLETLETKERGVYLDEHL